MKEEIVFKMLMRRESSSRHFHVPQNEDKLFKEN